MRVEEITSGQNPKVKELLALQEKSRERAERGLFVVEGRREFRQCLDAGFIPDTVFICPDIFGSGKFNHDTFGSGEAGKGPAFDPEGLLKTGCKVCMVSKEVYAKIAYRGGTEGIVAEIRYRERTLKDIVLGENPLVMVLESVEKPGNLGAVLRSADAAGADAVVVCDPRTDLYNPNLIRASLGAIFSRQVAAASSEETIAWLKANGIRILTAQLQDSVLYYDTPMQGPTALVMGTESTGLTNLWRDAADAHIRIPMLGSLDSLNVSVSAAILLFEALRQRHP
jgi:TrmH family RNA methyltransferase